MSILKLQSLLNKKNKKIDDVLQIQVIDELKKIFDPEIPVNIYDLGLIYSIIINNNIVYITMTLTTPFCPVAQTFPNTIKKSIENIKEVKKCIVELVWNPPWTKDKMSQVAKLELGIL